MTKHERFMLFVQAFVHTHAGSHWPSFKDIGSEGILQAALSIPESALPDDAQTASAEFTRHVTHLGYFDMLRPVWLPLSIIDYRLFQHKSEWRGLGYEDDDSRACRPCHSYTCFHSERLEAGEFVYWHNGYSLDDRLKHNRKEIEALRELRGRLEAAL